MFIMDFPTIFASNENNVTLHMQKNLCTNF
jgi:hypothetical protein